MARLLNANESKDVVKNWMRLRNTLEYLWLWEKLNNPAFKGANLSPFWQIQVKFIYKESDQMD